MAHPATPLAEPLTPFEVDTSKFPLVRLSLRGAVTLAVARAMTAALDERVFQRKQPYRLLIDANGMEVPNAEVRRHFVDFSSANSLLVTRLCQGEAYVIPSPLVRGALTAVTWLAPFKHPHRVFATMEEGEAWLTELGN